MRCATSYERFGLAAAATLNDGPSSITDPSPILPGARDRTPPRLRVACRCILYLWVRSTSGSLALVSTIRSRRGRDLLCATLWCARRALLEDVIVRVRVTLACEFTPGGSKANLEFTEQEGA